MLRYLASLCCLLALSLASSASAKRAKFGPIPTVGKTKSALQMRVVEYRGGTNGKMVVEVKNSSKKDEAFHAKGLYFVPEGDPEKAPQRLGAAGPFDVKQDGTWKAMEDLRVKPGQVVELQLDVFCIDSHRASPNSQTKFSFATERLPKSLIKKIESGTKEVMLQKKVKKALSAKEEVQGHIWKTRDSKWIKLQGERRREKGVRPQRRNMRPRTNAPPHLRNR